MPSFLASLFRKPKSAQARASGAEAAPSVAPDQAGPAAVRIESGAAYRKGDLIGQNYEVHSLLGRGGFGLVYLVYHVGLNSVYALKTFRDEFLADEDKRALFRREASVWVALERHPYLVRAHFVDEVSGRLYIAMEYIAPDEQGLNSLQKYLERCPPDLAQSLKWGIQFCHGMEYAYSRGVRCHRDIKPDNIMISQDRTVKISDFGLAGALRAASPTTDAGGARGDSIPGAMGTPPYMPPEQFEGLAGCDERSDIYSFGVVLYQMATGGGLPFCPGGKGGWREWQRLHNQAPMPRIDSPLYPLIEHCLAKEQGRRYQHFSKLRGELERLLQRHTGEVVEVPPQAELAAWELSNKGNSLESLGRYQEAIACYDQALALDARRAGIWNNKGASLHGLGRNDKAIACYDHAIALDPNDYRAWHNKGISLNDLERYREAVACFDRSIELDPRSAATWAGRGLSIASLGRHQEAIACYDRAIELDPLSASAWRDKGTGLLCLGRHQEAIACFDQALALDPRDAVAYLNKGSTLSSVGQHPEAVVCYDQAIALAPDYAAAWHARGNSLDSMGHCQEALDCYDKAIVLAPKDTSTWYDKGFVLAGQGLHREAVACYDTALGLDAGYGPAWTEKGNSLCSLGLYQEAIACYDRALALDARNVLAWSNKGASLAFLGHHQEAIVCYDQAVALAPGYALAWYNRAQAQEEVGRSGEATDSYRRFVALAGSEYPGPVAHAQERLTALERG